MKINQEGANLIKGYEALRLIAYLCPAGRRTIGWGHTKGVHLGMTISRAQAEQYFELDIAEFEEGVEQALQGSPVTQNQFSAMVSLAYNIGIGRFRTSSVLRFHRQGRYKLAAAAFLLFVYVHKSRSAGLVRRRRSEMALYLKDSSLQCTN